MSTLKSECRKFSPNVFNKTKCQNCFRTKDVHSAEALENNRASRNVSKCGYLFVAPDWDFNVSVNRTKRWQRRWFVLYDDGELTYALDEFPDTIPQGIIDMSKVLDVSDAESITGNDFAIAITTADKVHFIKGTSKEESKWWFDVLSRVLPRHLTRGKHKRNATFPCGKAAIPTPAVIDQDYCSEDDLRLNTYTRPKFLSSSDIHRNDEEWLPSQDVDEDEDVFPTTNDSNYVIQKDSDLENNRDVEVQNALNKLISLSEGNNDNNESVLNPRVANEGVPNDSLHHLDGNEAKRRNRRYLKRENRVQRNQHSRFDGVSKMIPTKNRLDTNVTNDSSDATLHMKTSAIAASEKLEYLESIHSAEKSSCVSRSDRLAEDKGCPALKDTPSSEKGGSCLPLKTNLRKSESLKNIPSEYHSEMRDHVSGLRRYHSFRGSSQRKIKTGGVLASQKKMKCIPSSLQKTAKNSSPTTVDNADENTSSESSCQPSLSMSEECTSEGVFTKTGWLMRQTLTKDWSRHWFVLKDSSLTYYRDSSSEHSGIMDGILDLNQVSSIKHYDSERFYAFCLLMWDGKKHILAAETEDFRRMWVQALQYATNLWSSASKEDFIRTEIVLPEHTFHHADRVAERISSPSSLSSLQCVDDDKLLETSSSSDDQSEYFSLVDEDEISDFSSSPRSLPPSPPVNRSMMSLVKERSKIRCIPDFKKSSISSGIDCTSCSISKNRVGLTGVRVDDEIVWQKYKDALHSIQQDEDIDDMQALHQLDQLENGSPRSSVDMDISDPTCKKQPILQYDQKRSNPVVEKLESEITDEIFVKRIPDENVDRSTIETGTTAECCVCAKVRSKLVAAKEEIRKLKIELKEAHASFDNLEMLSYKLKQDMKHKEENYESQISLLITKIDDLTSKFTAAERNYRQLKQKFTKSESKERRRSSLKQKDGLTLSKEYESKLSELEHKINHIETSLQKESSEAEDSEISDRSVLVSPTSDGSNGLLSRLQTLGTRVQKASDLVIATDDNKETDDTGNPKICVQVRDSEQSSSVDESDDWRTLSLNNSLSSLDKSLGEYPCNLPECQLMFSHKINKLLNWLKSSIDHVCQQKNISSDLVDGRLLLLANVTDVLDYLYHSGPTDMRKSDSKSICHSVLLFTEVIKFLKKLDNVEEIGTLTKLDIAEWTFQVLSKILCIAFAESDQLELSDVINLISYIPQIRYFSPMINKLFPKNDDDSEHFKPLPERLHELEEQRISILDGMREAKRIRFTSLWDTLAEVPVQDDEEKNSQKQNHMLKYVTLVASDVYRIAEIQLASFPNQALYILKAEYDAVHTWCMDTSKALKENLRSFLKELKENCPMISECTVPLTDLGDATRKKISCLVFELSFLCVSSTILDTVFANSESVVGKIKNQLLPYENWISRLETNYWCKANLITNDAFFMCSQCTTLNCLLSDSGKQSDWVDFLQKRSHSRVKLNECQFEAEKLQRASLPNTCVNCDSHFAGNIISENMCNNLNCGNLQTKYNDSQELREMQRNSLEQKYIKELEQMEQMLLKSTEVHDQEMRQKDDELLRTTTQLEHLKNEYEEQIQNLKNLYEQKLHFEYENIDEDSMRQMYQTEIEDIKDMFKKGLVAIETSHNRIASEMEKRHNDEITFLKAEKQRALELEAQATVTALEAIKKSHAKQLIEETETIRKQLFNRFQNDLQCESFYCKYGNELEELKTEILNITNMYSAKCLENVALEEKVNSLRKQLKEAHNELYDLLTRNGDVDLHLLKN